MEIMRCGVFFEDVPTARLRLLYGDRFVKDNGMEGTVNSPELQTSATNEHVKSESGSSVTLYNQVSLVHVRLSINVNNLNIYKPFLMLINKNVQTSNFFW